MAKQGKRSSTYPKQVKGGQRSEAGERYKDHNLMGMPPDAAQSQFQPTDKEPVSMHKKMAGC